MRNINFEDYAHYLQPRPRDWHKGLSGQVLVIGGDRGFSGAVRMAAIAALRVGCGLVTVATHPEHAMLINAVYPEIMTHSIEQAADLEPLIARADIIVMGPGLGLSSWSKELWNFTQQLSQPKVVDADALNILAQLPISPIHSNWILTPHPAEAGRLLHTSSREVQQDRVKAAQMIQQRYGGICVLKGAGSLVVDEHKDIVICNKGNPGMATAGMGDILSGVIGGLLAQHIPLNDAAKLGVYLHAVAGDKAASKGERGMIATDLLPYLHELVNLPQ